MSLNTSQSTEEGSDQIDDSFLTAHDESIAPLSIQNGNAPNALQQTDDTPAPPLYTPTLFHTHPHTAVLPVLLFEFLALSLTRAVLPSLLLQRYGKNTYVIMGSAECLRGILAFFACPLFGRISDVVGRRKCLFVTVLGTLAPVCSLVFWSVDGYATSTNVQHNELIENDTDIDTSGQYMVEFGIHIHRIDLFVLLLALSGIFSSTFTLTFAYISDVIKDKNGRVAAYGLALATFGLSFTIGPLLGGYLANVDDSGRGRGGSRGWFDELFTSNEGADTADSGRRRLIHAATNSSDIHPLGQHRVFFTTFLLAVLDLMYIYFILPESLNRTQTEYSDTEEDYNQSTSMAANSSESNVPIPAAVGVSRRASSSWWNPFDSIRYLTSDPLLSHIGKVTFLYYTALHAVVSTLILYAVRQFHLGPHRLGELMAALGLSTMLSETVLVRLAIPALGEKLSMRVGLISFAMQCTLLAVASKPWHLFACAFLAIPGNLVYPSVSSLVSTSVGPDMVGRALGAVNGVKSLTEGVGPLLFGTLLTMSEKDSLPGWPYFIAACMSVLAFHVGGALPSDDREDECKGMEYKYNIDLREEEEGEELLGR